MLTIDHTTISPFSSQWKRVYSELHIHLYENRLEERQYIEYDSVSLNRTENDITCQEIA